MVCRLFIVAVFVLVLAAGSESAQHEEKGKDNGKEKGKVSLVARTSPELRDHFREMFTKTFTENMNEAAMNRLLDDQIDQFVKRLVQKNDRLVEASNQLSQAADVPAQRHSITRIKDLAGDLEGTLRIWTDSLRAEKKLKEADAPELAPTAEGLVELVNHYKKQIDQFLFPEEVAISVKELQSEGFRGTLKKIQRVAQALEK
ncbi:MAG TPA: hypothetical protein VGL91_05860 [Acidobacteriota bacterium]|jgi:hypothetical protein